MLTTFLKDIFGGPSGAQAFAAAKTAYSNGELDKAERLLASFTKSEPAHAEARLYAGLVAYRRERYAEALTHFERANELSPSSSDCRYQAAAAEYALGNKEKAWRRCEEVLALQPNHGPAHLLMSHISLPGPEYAVILSAIHRTLRPHSYFEIGVDQGRSIRQVPPETRAVGIDPKPKIDFELPPNISVFAMTSDDYFNQRDVFADLGGPIELAFIDGLHHFEVALRDFINVERNCTPQSTVLVHDWYPLNRHTAERELRMEGHFYSGDVWRVALALKKYRPDLKLATIATAPTGLGVIRGLDPGSTVLKERYDAIVEEFMALDYGVLDQDKPGMLNLIPNDWNAIMGLFGSAGRDVDGQAQR